jgi:hypothetical protein
VYGVAKQEHAKRVMVPSGEICRPAEWPARLQNPTTKNPLSCRLW